MGMSNTIPSYSTITKIMHWLSAICVVAMFAVGVWMVDLDYYSSWYRTAPMYHKSVGILLAIFVITRIVYRLISPKVAPVSRHSRAVRVVSKTVHFVLYALMLTLFLSGYLISTADGRGIEVFNLFIIPSVGELFANQEDVAGEIHEVVAFTLIGLVIIHAAAAIKHHFIDKDETLKRML